MGNFVSIFAPKPHNEGLAENQKTQSSKSIANVNGTEERPQSIFSPSSSGLLTSPFVKSTSKGTTYDGLDGPQSDVFENHKQHTTCRSISSTATSGQSKFLNVKSSDGTNYDEFDGPKSEVFEAHTTHTTDEFYRLNEEIHPKISTGKSKKKRNTLKQIANSKTNPIGKDAETPSNTLSPRTNKRIQDVIDKGEYEKTESEERKLKLQIKEMILKAKEVEIACKEKANKKKTERNGDHLCPKKFLRSMHKIENYIIDLKDEKNKINEEKSDFMNRLSRVAATKLRDNNPNITDLQDLRRPMKLAEEYNKIYNDQWTDAMEGLEEILPQSACSNETCVHHLFSVIKAVYKSCKHRSELQLQGLAKHLFLMCNPSFEQIDVMLRENPTEREKILDNRKQTAIFAVEMLQQTMIDDDIFKTEIERCRPQLDDQMLAFLLDSSYFTKCIEVCWYMVIQDPPMYLETRSLDGTDLNKDTHKEYVTSGNKVQYVVWPALYQYLHNNGRKGPLMVKGVVQVAS